MGVANRANQEVKKDPRRYHNPALAPTAEEVEQVAEADSLKSEIDEALTGEENKQQQRRLIPQSLVVRSLKNLATRNDMGSAYQKKSTVPRDDDSQDMEKHFGNKA